MLLLLHCLLSPDGDDPIFIGINRLIAKGLNIDSQEREEAEYPCQVVNRFRCPYERINTKKQAHPYFDVDDLFKLQKMAFIVKIALAKARKEDSMFQIRDKKDLLNALTNRNILTKILQQADDILKSTEFLKEVADGQDNNCMADYFMSIKDKIDLDELRLY